MSTEFDPAPATTCLWASGCLLSDIQPFRPDWNQLEADTEGGNAGLIIAAGLFFSAAIVLAVVLLRRSRSRKSTTDTVDSNKQVQQPNKSAPPSDA